MLPPIPELHFDEEAHRYQYDGKWLPLSPTQVLSFDMDEEAKAENSTRPKKDQTVGRFAAIHCTAALNSSCLALQNLTPNSSANGLNRMVGRRAIMRRRNDR